ncbi:AAA family ATPase [Nocardiopsis sp. RSe5-2]|uniref:AAA family ATPase n=1 Tax=Nocardiopsis endophytica TaxID=3018445 RepID=A0ABT4U431_9ACTN|nr:AAA family ATPase [Nocardiopsis endophytica]MDA2811704.1 AAA family ATPase [Nocardiopsis endophytica]
MTSGPTPSATGFVSRLRIDNYKSIAHCDVSLGSLTVLAGYNAAGKTNLLDALRFVRDALLLGPGRAISERGGLDSILWRGAPSLKVGETRPDSFTISLDLSLPGVPSGSAQYTLEIGRPSSDEASFAVLHESCRLDLGEEASSLRTERVEPDGEHLTVRGGPPGIAIAAHELFLPIIGRLEPFPLLLSALTSPHFYDPDTDVLRAVDESSSWNRRLGERGEHLGRLLGLLDEHHPAEKERLDSYLRALIPASLGMDERRQGDFSTIQARFWDGPYPVAYWDAVNAGATAAGDPHVARFERKQLSEGTVRAAAVLAALFQPAALDASIPLLAIEEPELAIHPARVGAMYEALHDASLNTQILVTTQSSELLDDAFVRPENLLLVEMVDGATRVGGVDEHTRRYLEENPSQLGDMHRQGQLRPSPSPQEDSR